MTTEAIRIDPDARYIITIGNALEDPTELLHIQRMLTEWWESDAPFCIIAGFAGTTIRFERVKEGNDNGIGIETEVEDGARLLVGSQRDLG